MRKPGPLVAGVLLAVAGLSTPTMAAESCAALRFTYIEKPPYYYTDADGVPRGFVVERIRNVIADAGLRVRLESLPQKRALQEIRDNAATACSIGWFRTPEREAFTRFSLPIYHDQGLVAVLPRSTGTDSPQQARLAELLGRTQGLVGVVAGYSYGEAVDAALASLGQRLDPAPSPELNLTKLVSGRFGMALFNAEELDYLLARSPEMARQLLRVNLVDAPPGRPRHLICTGRLADTNLERINRAIRRQGFDRP